MSTAKRNFQHLDSYIYIYIYEKSKYFYLEGKKGCTPLAERNFTTINSQIWCKKSQWLNLAKNHPVKLHFKEFWRPSWFLKNAFFVISLEIKHMNIGNKPEMNLPEWSAQTALTERTRLPDPIGSGNAAKRFWAQISK